MATYQYIYVMKGLGKSYPGGREVLRDIWLSFFPGLAIGLLVLSVNYLGDWLRDRMDPQLRHR